MSGEGSGTENTPLCNLQKIKTAQVLQNYLNGVLENAYSVWFDFGSVFFYYYFTGISKDIGQKGLKYN